MKKIFFSLVVGLVSVYGLLSVGRVYASPPAQTCDHTLAGFPALPCGYYYDYPQSSELVIDSYSVTTNSSMDCSLSVSGVSPAILDCHQTINGYSQNSFVNMSFSGSSYDLVIDVTSFTLSGSSPGTSNTWLNNNTCNWYTTDTNFVHLYDTTGSTLSYSPSIKRCSTWLSLPFRHGNSSSSGTALYRDLVFSLRYMVVRAGDPPAPTPTPTPPPVFTNPTITGTGDYTNTLPGPISPLPVGSAGNICYLCTSPTGTSMYMVSLWVAWLGCVLRNMFTCDLRVWLHEIANSTGAIAVMGIELFNYINGSTVTTVSWLSQFQSIPISFINWINGTVQAGVTWAQINIQAAMSQATAAYNAVSEYLSIVPQQVMVTVNTAVTVTEAGTDWLATLWAIITVLFLLLIALLGVIVSGMLGLLILLIMMVTAILTAFQAPPYEFHIFTGLGGDPLAQMAAVDITSALAADGPNQTKMYTFLLWSLHAADTAVAGFDLGWLMFLLMGMIGMTTAVIIIREWKQILPN